MQLVIALSCIVTLFSAPISGQDICPVTTSLCYCEITYGTRESLYCDNLGSVANVPTFQSCSRVFTQLAIRRNSAIDAVQNFAFEGLQLMSLSLQNLKIRSIDEYAFEGLGDSLQELHLEGNQLNSLPASCLRNLTKLSYVGLNNNILASISESMFATLGQLNTLYFSYNEIETLGIDSFLGLGTLYALYLKQNRLSRLTPGVFDSLNGLYILDLSYNRLSSNISNGVLSVLVRLQRLTLSNNQLTGFDGLLTGLRELTNLDVSSNNMESIPSGQFDDSTKLISLNMSANSISSIADRAFANAPQLQSLYLDDNRLKIINASIFAKMSGLQNLALARNAITDIVPGSFSGTTNLKNLYLSGNELEAVGKGWFDGLSMLQTLDLSNNRVNTIDLLAFVDLSKLRTLHLQNNNLVTVTPGIFRSLQNLNTLNVHRNVISFLDENAFSHVTGLRYLHLEYNNISEVPSLLFQNTPNIETVYLSYNRISVISSDAYPAQTKYLYLDNNRITEIPRYAFPDGMQLVTLNLSGNFIDTVYQESFSRLSGLGTLALDDNSLTDLPDYMLRNDQNLITLSLSGNRLRNITSPTVFQGLVKAAIIELDNNRISTVAYESVAHMKGLTQLDLSNNPIQCDCIVDWMRGYAPLVGLMDTVCSSPALISGQLAVCFNQSNVCTAPTTPLNSTVSLCNDLRFMTTKTIQSTTTRTSPTTKLTTTRTSPTTKLTTTRTSPTTKLTTTRTSPTTKLTTTRTSPTSKLTTTRDASTVNTITQPTSSTTKNSKETLSETPPTKTSSELFSMTSTTKTLPEIFSTTTTPETSTKMLSAAQTTKTIVELYSTTKSLSTELLTTVPPSSSSYMTLSTIAAKQSSTAKLLTTTSSETLTKLKTVDISTATLPVTTATVLTGRSTKQATISLVNMQTKASPPVPSETHRSTEALMTQSETFKSTSETSRAIGKSIQDTTPVLITSRSGATGNQGSQATTSSADIILSSVTNTPVVTSQRVSFGTFTYPETSSSSSSSSTSSSSFFPSTSSSFSSSTSVSEESSRNDTSISADSLWSLSSRTTQEPIPHASTLSPSYETSISQSDHQEPYNSSSPLRPSTDTTSYMDGVIELKVFPDEVSITVTWTVSTSHKIFGLRLLYRYVNSDQNLGSISLPPNATNYRINGLSSTLGYEFAVCIECTLSANASGVSTSQKCEVTRLTTPATDSPISYAISKETLIIVTVVPILVAIAVALLVVIICCWRATRNRKVRNRSLQQLDSEGGTGAHPVQGSRKALLTGHVKLQSVKHAPAEGAQGSDSTSNRPRSPPLASTQQAPDKPLSSVTFDNPIYPTFPHQGQPRNTPSSSNNAMNPTHSPASGNVDFPNSSAVTQAHTDNHEGIILTKDPQETSNSSDNTQPQCLSNSQSSLDDFGSTDFGSTIKMVR